ncbi:MAG: hypothetical protein KDA85_17760, partial [Planctomycetaceae bacterium]|nr:hypothetical protein [Planctomycetaceae bacterium]
SPAFPPVPFPVDPVEVLLRRVEETAPELLMGELKALNDKLPVHYYLMALLADTMPVRAETDFADCLLTGIQAFPGDPGLRALLYSFCRLPLPPKVAASLLVDIAKEVHDDQFYSLTEPLWDILMRNQEFAEVLALLQQCEARMTDFQSHAKLAFMLHLLRFGIWKAEADWVESTFQFIEENSRLLSSYAEGELDLLQLTWEYKRNHVKRDAGPGLADQMHAALQSYFLLPEEERDRPFVECQIRIASSVDLVQSTFPEYRSETPVAILNPWIAVGREIVFRQQGNRPRSRELDSRIGNRIRSFLLTQESMTNRSFRGLLWNSVALLVGMRVAMVLLAGLLVVVVGTSLHSVAGLKGGLSAANAFASGLLGLYPIEHFVVQPCWNWFCGRMARQFYRSQWRRALLLFLADSRLHPNDFRRAAAELRGRNLDSATWLLAFMSGDPAVYIYSLAQVHLS